MIKPYSLEWHLQFRNPEMPDTDRRLAHWLKQLDVTDTDGLFRAAKEIMDNLPRLHEQSLDTLIRLATEKAHAAGMRIELIAHGPEETPEPTDRLTAIESLLASLESTKVTPAPEQSRTYPAVEWMDGMSFSDAIVNGLKIGTAYLDGTFVCFGAETQMKDGNIESAKHALESKFREWWDELHPQQS